MSDKPINGGRSILARIPLYLAREGIWHDPAEIILVHHPRYGFNGEPVENVISLVAAEPDDIDFLEDGYTDEPGTPVDPSDLMGNHVCITAADARALAKALLDAADKIDASGIAAAKPARRAKRGSTSGKSPAPAGGDAQPQSGEGSGT
jgi:hypothetical protein